MAITVTELPKRAATQDKETTTYTRVFQAVTDSAATGAHSVLYASGIPAGFDPHPENTDAVVTNINVSEVDVKVWEVTVEYSNAEEDQEENPLARDPEISWSFAQSEEIVDVDVDGNAVVNSVGDPFDPSITRDFSRPVLSITQNFASFDGSLANDYHDAVNSDNFAGASPGTLKLAQLSASNQKEGSTEFWQVTAEFHYRRDGWTKKVLDQGMRQLSEDGTSRAPIVIEGREITSPVPLDGEGGVLGVGADPVLLKFDVYEERSFSALGFNI